MQAVSAFNFSKVFALLTLCSGCALDVYNEQSNAALDFGAVVNGYSKKELLACAGTPSNRQVSSNGEIWTYIHEAYKDPTIYPPGSEPSINYRGLAYVAFDKNMVSDVRFSASPDTTVTGFKMSEKFMAGLSLPVFSKC